MKTRAFKLQRIFLYGTIFLLSFKVSAQELPKIIPPSPTAYEMTKQGFIPVGLLTGTPNVNVPIYTFSTPNITVPISLNYSSSGIKVDQLTSNVGLGWSLSSGGVISRIVRGKEDENYVLEEPIDEIMKADLGSFGYLQDDSTSGTPTTFPQDLDPYIAQYLYDLGNDEDVDGQSDLFSYSFPGYSGKIVINAEGKVYTLPHSNLKVEAYQEFSSSAVSLGTGFIITTPEGVVYSFLDTETSIGRSYVSGSPTGPDVEHVTAWYLSKIEHPAGDIVNFVYENLASGYHYLYSTGESHSYEIPEGHPVSPPGNLPGASGIIKTRNDVRIYPKRLTEINSNFNNGKIVFDNSTGHPTISNYKLVNKVTIKDPSNTTIEEFDFNYLTTNNDRIFLTSVELSEATNKYTFTYDNPSSLPERLNYGQDYWGYYNGNNNLSLLPEIDGTTDIFEPYISSSIADRTLDATKSKYGLLTKVTYPTKGFTEIEYESNSYYGPSTSSSTTTVTLNISTNHTDDDTFTMPSLGGQPSVEAGLNFDVEKYVDVPNGCEDYPSHKVAAKIKLTDLTSSTVVYENTYTEGNGSTNFSVKVDLLASHQYKLELLNDIQGNTYGDWCVDANAQLKYSVDTNNFTNILTGGNRVKSMKNYTSTGNLAGHKRYYYGKKESVSTSSGDAKKEGVGFVSQNIKQEIGPSPTYNFYQKKYNVLRSSSNFPIVNSGSSNVYYKYVTISEGGDSFENGGEEHEFTIHRDYHGEILTGQADLIIPNFTNFGWDNGLEKKVTYFKDNGSVKTTLKEVINTYTLDSIVGEVNNYYVAPYYNLVGTLPDQPTYKCTSADTTKQIDFWQCQSTNHKHRINDGSFLGYTSFYGSGSYGPLMVGNYRCRHSNANNQKAMTRDHACYGLNADDIVSYPELIANLNVMKYKSLSHWYYKSQNKDVTYDLNGQNPIETVTTYNYDNFDHLMLTSTETTNSSGEVLKTKTYYPDDVSGATSLEFDNLSTPELTAIDSLKAQYKIGAPLQVESYKDNVLLSAQRTNYKDWGANASSSWNLILPEYVQTLKGTNSLENRVQYHDYDDYGKPLNISKTQGTEIYYIWGYNDTKPIAKIENFTASQASSISSLITAAVNASNSDSGGTGSDGALRTALNSIRNNSALNNALMTSFTYDPMVGVTSVTDPRGDTVYYEYDQYNRLEYIKDKNGKILSQTQYNYKQ
ncbi:hypothetical protein [Pontimicrobium sp. SW4]|uniref:RHS repeat protein n=1 Tax=Pontimicrobium sp. SW4 TaxID=3153519 RepID=A0AAU7BUZ6_9FLAO